MKRDAQKQKKMRLTTKSRSTRGQSLVETALMLPLLILVVLNVVNLGYFFLVTRESDWRLADSYRCTRSRGLPRLLHQPCRHRGRLEANCGR